MTCIESFGVSNPLPVCLSCLLLQLDDPEALLEQSQFLSGCHDEHFSLPLPVREIKSEALSQIRPLYEERTVM